MYVNSREFCMCITLIVNTFHVLRILECLRIIVILLIRMNFTLNKIYVYNSVAKIFNKHSGARYPIKFSKEEELNSIK